MLSAKGPIVLLPALTLLTGLTVLADDESNRAVYRLPDQKIADIIDAPLPPRVELSPDRTTLLLMDWQILSTVEVLAEEELRLAGLRIKPSIHGRSRTAPTTGLSLVRIADRSSTAVGGLPASPRLGNFAWSPNGRRVIFTHTGGSGIELWLLELASASARAISGPILNLTAGVAPTWIDDGSVLAALVSGGQRPAESPVPSGPVIQENLGTTSPARTYQDLLQNEHHSQLFEFYFTSQLARLDLDGSVTELGKPGLHFTAEASPDGRYLLVETLHRPFSYLVRANRFPKRTEIWSLGENGGEPVRTVYDRPLQESIPIARGSVATGVREARWRADDDATLVWAEALDGGDAGREAEQRDRISMLSAPFDGEAIELATLAMRFSDVIWGSDDVALVYEWWWKTRTVRAWHVRPADPSAEAEKIFDYSWQDRYADPGDPLTGSTDRGREVLRLSADGDSIFLIGDGASPSGDRPFLDRLDLASGETERLFHSGGFHYERPIDLLDDVGQRILTRREALDKVPNYFVRTSDSDGSFKGIAPLTGFPHPTPELRGLTKEIVRYERADGVPLSGTLYLPPRYSPERDGPLPLLMWAYPIEFKSADAAGQIDDSPYRFARIGWWSPLIWLSQGYAVLDDPKMPIIGEGDDEPNDMFREQLVASAKAAVDEMVRRRIADPKRIAIGGHSYGAFMTANLLAHSDLFAAGIARSGAYNRTLTPFGFQSEERTLWEAREVYFSMSPFMHAEKVNEPILLIHGAADNNSGTFPLQSERYYNALKGHGATARLVMLPLESHGYRGRESVLHQLWETERWLRMYIGSESASTSDGAR